MEKNKPNKPEDEEVELATETPTDLKNQPDQPLEAGGENTPPEMTAKETATLAQEVPAPALQWKGIGKTGLRGGRTHRLYQ